MEPFSIASLGVGLAGSVLGGLFGSQQAELQKRAALESARRANLQNQETLAEATLAAGASGFEAGGSMSKYLADMSAEFRRQNEWNVQQAEMAGDASSASNMLGTLTGIGSSLFTFGKANNWFQGAPSAKAYAPGFGQPLWR